VKIIGEVERLDHRHRARSRRRWRALPLAVDAATPEIVAVELRPDDVGAVSAVLDLPRQIDRPVGSVTADGVHDGGATCDTVSRRAPNAHVIVRSGAMAVLSESGTTRRDEHIRSIQKHGRIRWQQCFGNRRRSLVETAIHEYKTIIGRRLHDRTLLCPIKKPRPESPATAATG
jgi:hypothetical protein